MRQTHSPIRRASSTLRAVVIALSTFAILLVVFSLYQYGQRGGAALPARERLPAARTDFTDLPSAEELQRTSGVIVENAVVGPAQGMTITIYRPEGTEAAAEVTVRDWLPKEGADQEFLLREPVIRLRTKAGNDVRVSAEKGVIEAQQQLGGVMARRGQLMGNVLVEVDRRTAEQKASLSEEERNTIDAASLVRIEANELEFDLEYSRLLVPGAVNLRASDATFDFSDLEIRFNEAEGRVESMRVARGGRIELFAAADAFGLDIPGGGDKASEDVSVVEWLQNTVRARMAEQGSDKAPRESGVEEAAEKTAQSDKPAVSYNKEGIPVFRPSGAVAEKPTSKTPPTYLARFEGNVDGRQDVDGATQARLTAQVLQIVREFGASESRPTREVSANGTPQSNGKPAAESSTERLILTWEGPLVVESLSAGDSRKEGQARSRIEASGQPARLAGADGEVVCEALSYEPDDGLARFTGSQSQPAVVRSARDGEMRGRSVALRVEGERFFIDVEGPGRVQGDVADVGAAASAGGTGDGAAAEADVKSAPSITFSRELHATGRVVEQLEANLAAATLRRTKARLLETMTADGDVRAAEKAASLSTDSLDLRFGLQKRWGADKLFVERVLARGQTLLQDKDNRMSSRELEVELIAGATGKSLPVRAVATGGVSALQGGRTLTADDELVIDFERLMFTQVRAEAGSASAPGMAAPATQVPQAVQGAPVAATSGAAEKAVARTLRARGNVTVNDPGQGMELTADEATCSLKDGEVEQALVAGTADAPATVRTPKFAVTGANIRAHIPDEWAEVPGEGRMTIHSLNDLSGRRRPEPKPIAVTWKESMGYRGRENVAHFRGGVHASDDDGTTFDCRELRAEFIVQPPEDASEPEMHWGFFQPLRDQVVEWRGGQPASRGPTDLNRDLSSIYASGDVVMQKVNADAAGTLKTRARISGPKLALNLREETSRALIEGAGNLQLEDFETTPADVAAPTAGPSASLLSLDGAGPSKTLVQWTGRMWYDFSIDQIRFEEGVDLRHLSGKQLERFFQVADRPQKPSGEGLASFLTSDLLVLDFVPPQEGVAREFGRISADQIREFRAQGNVRFQDETKKLSVEASEVIYPKARRVLIISGMPRQKARIVQHRDGALPTQLDVERAFINLATNEIELAAPVGVQGG